jgi:predicted nuclease of predicted toxin-antitoxin system
MRFLADENVERPIVEAVRALGHDVAYVSEMSRGVDDEWLLKLANQEQCVLITNDKDFGELVYLRGQAAAGVLLLRFRVEKSSVKAALVNVFLQEAAARLAGHFVVLNESGARIRPLR